MSETREHREIERKLDVPARFRLPALAGAQELPKVRLTATYFDTGDLRLARSGITLRRREGGSDAGWHLKLPHEDDATRDELQLPLSAGDDPPAALSSIVLAVTRGAPLAPVAVLRTERRPVALVDSEGKPLAELTDDRVAILSDGRVTSRFRELEVEAAPLRTAEDLDDVVALLVSAGATVGSFTSKARRALGERAMLPPDVGEPGEVGPDDPAGDVVQSHLTRHAAAFLRQDTRARRGLPDSVHQLRVAARRLRSGLKAFGPLVEQEWSQHLRDELRWIASVLGEVRDRDVLEARLLDHLARLDADIASAESVVRATLGAEVAQAWEAVGVALESPRYLALLDALVEAANEPRLTPEAQAPCRVVLPGLMASVWKRLDRDVRRLRKKGPDDAWHQARIHAKYARYAVEAVAPVFGKAARQMAEQLEQVTETLGEHQDAAIAADAARTLAAADGVKGSDGYVFGLLHEAERRDVTAARRAFLELWPKVAKDRHRKWLEAR